VAAGILVLAVVAISTVVAFRAIGDGTSDATSSSSTSTKRSAVIIDTTPTTVPPTPSAIPTSAVDQLLAVYATAYSAKDLQGLRNLFTSDMTRVRSGDPPQNLAAALADYESQFEQLSQPVYRLTNTSVNTTDTQAYASATYAITDGSRLAGRGRIDFYIVAINGYLYIYRIEITPS